PNKIPLGETYRSLAWLPGATISIQRTDRATLRTAWRLTSFRLAGSESNMGVPRRRHGTGLRTTNDPSRDGGMPAIFRVMPLRFGSERRNLCSIPFHSFYVNNGASREWAMFGAPIGNSRCEGGGYELVGPLPETDSARRRASW